MSWVASIIVGVLTAVVGCAAAGLVAGLAVDWYRISSFEGKSGYFVVAFALLGIVAGLAIGIVTSRVMAGSTHPFLKSLGESTLIVIGIAGVIAGIARLSADVPPTLGGQTLLLVVEMRWPASQKESPAADTTPRRLRLYSTAGRTTRTSEDGALWMEDARLEQGHWIVPGAVQVFTSRGGRMLSIEPPLEKPIGFELPLPAWPTKAQLAWSEWIPRARAGSPPLPDGLRLRFKVLPADQPVRTQTFGPFQVATVASSFYDYGQNEGEHGVAASATFLIRHRGKPVTIDGHGEDGTTVRFDRAESVALLPGAPDALLVRAGSEEQRGPVYLIVDESDHVRTELVSDDPPQGAAPLVTNDVARFRRARHADPLPGVVDRTTYAEPGDFLFAGALLSTQPAAVHRFETSTDLRLDPNVRPLGISPDARRFVRVGFAEDYKTRELVVTDAVSGESSHVPIDAAATRIGEISDLDPEWLQHYYAWVKGPDGQQRLEPRTGVKPLPYRGSFSVPSGGYREYRVQPAGDAMFEAFTNFLADEMGATRTPEDLAASSYQTHVEGQVVHVFNNHDDRRIGIYMDRNQDSRLVVKIGERFDAALATGKYDTLFEAPAPIR